MKRILMILILLAAIAFGAYAACRYYQDEYLPEQKKQQDIERTAVLFEDVRPEQELPTESRENHEESGSELEESIEIPETAGNQDSETVPDDAVYVVHDTYDVYDASAIPDDLPEVILAEDDLLETGKQLNSDMIGWIVIPDTDIDYPIVWCDNNDFYLDHGLDKEPNQLGVPFLDYKCEPDFSGFNSIVYAHNMEWVLLFAEVYRFKTPSYLWAHPYGWLTVGTETHRVDFFAYLTVPDGSDAYQTIFITDSEKADYLEYLREHSVHTLNQPPQEELLKSRLLLLSTCTFEYKNARGILAGVIR